MTKLHWNVKLWFAPWRIYKARKGPQQGMGVTKGWVGRIARGNHHSFSKFLEMKELKKNRETVQTFQEVGTSLEDDFHGNFLSLQHFHHLQTDCYKSNPWATALLIAGSHRENNWIYFILLTVPSPLSSLKNLHSHFPPAYLHVHLICQVAALLTEDDEKPHSRSSSISFFPLDGAMGFSLD